MDNLSPEEGGCTHSYPQCIGWCIQIGIFGVEKVLKVCANYELIRTYEQENMCELPFGFLRSLISW